MTLQLFDELRAVLAQEDDKATAGQQWLTQARPNQLAPDGDWFVWLILAGRGWGKTRAAAEWCAQQARRYPGARFALVAATFADGRDVMVEGESGLLSVLDDSELLGNNRESAWKRLQGRLLMANGSQFKIYSSEKTGSLRGPQHHFAWCDEVAQWPDAHKGSAEDSIWSNLLMGMRLKVEPTWDNAYQPRIVAATTPRPLPLLKVPDSVAAREPARRGIMQRDDAVITKGTSSENIGNLASTFVAAVIDPLKGTTLGRQELEGELIEDFEGALVPRGLIERSRVPLKDVWHEIEHSTRVVSVDPAVTTGEKSDLTGIVVVGTSHEGNVHVLGDHTMKASPDQWALAVWAAVAAYGAMAVIVEDNQGGDMVEHVLMQGWRAFQDAYRFSRSAEVAMQSAGEISKHLSRPVGVMPGIKRVHPSGPNQGKWLRAQPLRLLYEQGRVRHVVEPGSNMLERIEEQLSTWTGEKGEKSPDRVDALVHGVNYLMQPADRRADRYGRRIAPQGHRWTNMRGR